MPGWAFWVIFGVIFFSVLGSLCIFYFIDKIVSVQYIVQFYADKNSK